MMEANSLKTRFRFMAVLAIGVLLVGCSGKVPRDSVKSDTDPILFPDYKDVIVPVNIAPLNFCIQNNGKDYRTEYRSGTDVYVKRGDKPKLTVRKWHALLANGPVTVTVYVKENGRWNALKPFSITPAGAVDQYVSYRRIPPSYQQYEEIRLMQRDLSSFKLRTIYNAGMVQRPAHGEGQCVNCHNFKNWQTDDMQFHARHYKGGTVILHDGELKKNAIKSSDTGLSGVYPSWHPTLPLIAYSTNNTVQVFHTTDINHIEVFDTESDLNLYNVETGELTVIENDPGQFECFPSWSPDGRTLFYVSARCPDMPEGTDRVEYLSSVYDQIRYDLYAKPFDPETGQWGESRMLINASEAGVSITLPRVSPDGRRLMFACGDHGVFHIWHKDADLFIMDLVTGQVRPMEEVNSPDTESYHSWSSSGEWVTFATRREDGGFTRIYLTHANADGTFSKPFPVPSRDPYSKTYELYSNSVPELTVERVKTTPHQLSCLVRK